MKAIVKLSVGCVALAVTLSTATAIAVPHLVMNGLTTGMLAVGQPEARSKAAGRQEADKWLSQARQAIKNGNLEMAEYCVERAERLNVKYDGDALFAAFKETPEAIRRDLAKMRAARAAAPQTPASLASRGEDRGSGSSGPPRDPYAAKAADGSRAEAKAYPANDPRALQPGGGTPNPLSGGRSAGVAPFAFDVTGDMDRLPPVGAGALARPARDATKAEALRLTALARASLDRGDLATAQRLAEQAQGLKVPESAFAPGETRPWEVLLEIEGAINRRGSGAVTARSGSYPVAQGLYTPDNDPTRNVLAQATAPSEGGPTLQPTPRSPGWQLYQQGLQALENHDRESALQLFRQAWQYQGELDPATRQRLKDKLNLLGISAHPGTGQRPPSPLQEVGIEQEVLRQKLFREVANEQQTAERTKTTDPMGARERMQRLRDRVSQAEIDPASRKQLLTLVDRSLQKLDTYIRQYRSDIELNKRNRETLQEIDLHERRKQEIQDKIAELVERFNLLMEEQRFAEAEVIASQVRELDPESPITRLLTLKGRLASRVNEQQWLRDKSEQGFMGQTVAVQESAIPFDDRNPVDFGDISRWSDLSVTRLRWLESQSRQLTPAEKEIQEALKQQVEVRFTDRPLKEVLETLGSMVGVNVYPDPMGLAAEGVTTNTPVTINLTQPLSLRSALKLILTPLRLSFVIQNEVLLVSSEQTKDSNVYTRVYNVADLIIPIPNFIPGYNNVGLPAAIREAHDALGYGGVIQPASMAPLTIAANATNPQSSVSASVLAQNNGYGMQPKSASRPSRPVGFGAGGMGGAAMADFDSLIELITATIAPDTWDEVGGPGAIESFPTNLSLVISQTQDVHDQIADLLEQLRRLQDLQVTIEVRFITLRDDWFEYMGIDFDFDIDDNVLELPFDDAGPSTIVGLGQDGTPTGDFDISFTQGGFGSAVPQFGGFDATTAATIGFAMLSDIEVFFLLRAAEADQRSNVMQAPKVTLFNGQMASVFDTSQRPFVTSLIPVVGDFAAAHQPVIVVLSEGTSLSVQAVISSDRRFVRLTLVPFFSQIGEVETFTFKGKTTTNTGSNVTDPDGNPTGDIDNAQTETEGTTVQLPTFSFTTVSTTVSVPDGGTVLLGGIKRLREGRNEEGVPMLSKIPYVSRLFRNVGIGRETQSLMLMVTPRIIIYEEEEEKLGIELE